MDLGESHMPVALKLKLIINEYKISTVAYSVLLLIGHHLCVQCTLSVILQTLPETAVQSLECCYDVAMVGSESAEQYHLQVTR